MHSVGRRREELLYQAVALTTYTPVNHECSRHVCPPPLHLLCTVVCLQRPIRLCESLFRRKLRRIRRIGCECDEAERDSGHAHLLQTVDSGAVQQCVRAHGRRNRQRCACAHMQESKENTRFRVKHRAEMVQIGTQTAYTHQPSIRLGRRLSTPSC
jgi:hypothetical protein|eukprot:SAG25_NODE_1127_length_3875_cov_3.733316_4_plen_156_part_00